MNKDSVSLIVNGVLAAGIVALLVLHKLDTATALALLGVASAPGAGNVLLSRLVAALKADPPAPDAK